MKISICYLTILFALLLPLHAMPMEIVRDHKPTASIVIPVDAGKQIWDCARILQNYIKQSAGAVLPISEKVSSGNCIHIGMTPYVSKYRIPTADLDENGFIMKGIGARNFVIVGGSDWGTEFGVYAFLEHYLGVLWLMPGDDGVIIPNYSNIDIPSKEIRENPVYLTRGLGEWGEPWSSFNRFNKAAGAARIAFGENLHNLFPPSKFAQSNREFYPWINGRRFIPARDDKRNRWQPNFSAKGIADTAASQIIKYFDDNPQSRTFSIAINDTRAEYDESPASKARRNGKENFLGIENTSDDYFLFANEVVKKVRRVHPDKWIGCLAYNNVIEPPEKVDKLDDHLIPFICYERMRWANPELQKAGHELNMAWEKKVSALGWYDYAWGLNYLVPRVFPHEMQKYLRWGSEHKVKYYFSLLKSSIGEGPKSWLFAKLLWNPYQNVDSLLNIWYVGVSGKKAAPKLESFYKIWEKFWTEDIYHTKWNIMGDQYLPFTVANYANEIPESYIQQSDQLMIEALHLTETEAQKVRVKKLYQAWQLYKAAVIAHKSFPHPITDYNEGELKDWESFLPSLRVMAISKEVNNLWKIMDSLKPDPVFNMTVDQMIQRTTLFNWIQKVRDEMYTR